MSSWILVFGWLWDFLIGDPRTSWHPVCILGNWISFWEKRLLSAELSPAEKRTRGIWLVVIILATTFIVAAGIQWLIWQVTQSFGLSPWISWIVSGLLMSFTLSIRSLREAGQEIKGLLATGDFLEARKKVSWIVGRDTENMNESEMTRATVETIAENITDGIIAPLFYGALGGMPLAWVYRATNTMDSMVGYKNETYLDFGRAAALWDDVANYVPGRVTGFLLLIVGWISRLDAQNAWMIWRRDAVKHPSPNSGIPESVTAGLLGIQLGGENFYGGISSKRALMGDPKNPLTYQSIQKVIFLMEGTAVLGVLFCVALQELLQMIISIR